MDLLLNDEIFGQYNDDLLQSPQMDTELWSDELINDLHNANQFFNDQDFDTNHMTLSFEEENKISNKAPKGSNIFQVSQEVFSRGVSPDCGFANSNNLTLPLKTVTFLHKRKSSLDCRDTIDLCLREPKRFLYEHDSDNALMADDNAFKGRHTAQYYAAKLIHSRDDKRPMAKCGRASNDRTKYSLSPSTSSPDSAIDYSTISNGLQQPHNNGDHSFANFSNNIQNRFIDLKYKSHKDNLFSTKLSNCTRFFQSPIPQTGLLILTEEEKRTLLSEGYPIPYRLPLTKQEERNLKKVRRKIKNKISAQESRRKKKEYMEALEKKVEIFAYENNELRKKLENQEITNKSLVGQLRHLQHMLGRASSNTTSTCVMVFLICFSLILVGLPEINQPMKLPQSVLVVGNIHKLGYGALLQRERSHMTAMRRYFPPDIDGFVNISYDPGVRRSSSSNERILRVNENKGIKPLDSLESPVTGQRKSILLGNLKEEEDECVQYGPRYLWWLLQSPNYNIDDSHLITGISAPEHSDSLQFHDSVMATIVLPPRHPLQNESSLGSHQQRWSNSSTDSLEIAVTSIST